MGVYKKEERWYIDYYLPTGKRKREVISIILIIRKLKDYYYFLHIPWFPESAPTHLHPISQS